MIKDLEERTSVSTEKVTQIVLVGWDYERVLAGIRSFPLNKLILLPAPQKEREMKIRGEGRTSRDYAEKIKQAISEVMKVQVEMEPIHPYDFENTFKKVKSLIKREQSKGSEVLVNVSSGTKIMSAAAICAAFLCGAKTCYTIPEMEAYEAEGVKETITLPMLIGFKPLQVLSNSALQILKVLKNSGGGVETMKALGEKLGWSKEEWGKLSYHISKLESYGLIKTERLGRELAIQLTKTGTFLISE